MIALRITNLLACVFTIDITECPHCSEFLRIVAALTKPRSIHFYLDGVDLSARSPSIAPARARICRLILASNAAISSMR